MLGFIFRRAQATVDNAISVAVSRAIVAVPFLVAAGFGIAALSTRLNRLYDSETADLILAGLFVGIGFITMLIVWVRNGTTAETAPVVETQAAAGESPAVAAENLSLSPEDRELLVAALTAAAPMALPAVLRLAARNLPLLVTLVVAAYSIFRLAKPTAPDEGTGENAHVPRPAEQEAGPAMQAA